MATVGSLSTTIRKMVGDPDRDWLDENTAFDFINRSQRRFCHKVLPLDEFEDYTITAKKVRYDLPTNTIIPVYVHWFQSRTQKLEYTPPDVWAQVVEAHPNASGIPERYTVLRRQLTVGPQTPQTASKNTTASGAMSSTTATLDLVAASGTFRSKGWVKIDSEIIEYTGVATTTLTGATRGVHGTSGASHASGTTLTEIDMQMLHRKTPTIITASGDTPEIPAAFHDYLEKYAVYLAWLANGETQKAQAALQEFMEYENSAVKTVGRRAQDGLLHIQEKRRRGRW